MIVHTKYSIGDSVIGIYQATEIVTKPCEKCGGKGEVELKDGGALPCPNRYAFRAQESCNGGKVTLGFLSPWQVQPDSAGQVGQVRVVRTMHRFVDSTNHDRDRNEYMVTSTGVGSGRIWYEDLLYPNTAEAQAECDRRNADPTFQEERENILNGFFRRDAESKMVRRIEEAAEPAEAEA